MTTPTQAQKLADELRKRHDFIYGVGAIESVISKGAKFIECLEAENASLRKQNEAQKDEWLSWNEKRAAMEKDAARYQLIRRGQHWSIVDGIGNDLRGEDVDAAIDAIRASISTSPKERA